MDREILETVKDYIEHDQLEEIQTYFQQLFVNPIHDYRLPWEYLFQQCYLHACLKQKRRIVEWFETTVYNHFNEVTRIALRQSFAYGHYLLNKKQLGAP
jgi:hypothetical protein